jgi:AraC-like DNA-binding protein
LPAAANSERDRKEGAIKQAGSSCCQSYNNGRLKAKVTDVAKERIFNSRSVNQIAVSWTLSTAAFYRLFKQVVWRLPNEYRMLN